MQSLFKSRKKRDSHGNKSGDDGSSIDGSQRSPSGSSAKSSESPLKAAQNGLNSTQIGGAIAGVVGGASASGSSAVQGLSSKASGALNNATSHLPQGMQQQSQQYIQTAQNEASKMLNSPFMGSHAQQQGQQGNQPGHPQGHPQGNQHPQGHNGAPGQYPGGQYAQNQRSAQGGFQGSPGSSHGLPHGMPQQGASPQYYDQRSAMSPAQKGGSPQGIPHGQPPHGQPPHGQPPHGQPRGSPSANGGQQHNGQFLVNSPQQQRNAGPNSAQTTPNPQSGTPAQPGSAVGGFASPLSQPSDTPWAEYNVQRAAPSPRFGHSANYLAARDGELFIMGGIRDMDILNDLWVIDTNTLTGYQLVTDGVKVGPRVGHASLVLGNAHVVFGGDTKIEESDPLDDNLYLLNTSSLKWTVAQPQGPRPTGRYGHSLSNIGARVYVFGGQVDEEFYDDMWAFDLTNWRSQNARWEKIQSTTPPPPPRTNHTVVTHKDKLYLFGGANGDLWYSDTWCFDPATRAWEQLECSGYVPSPCQGHASTIIDDVMYVFGGMSSQGVLIDQLFALKLTTLKWYTFQNLGPGPSPRSGHSLTAFGGDKILVWGGTDQGNSAYVLDVSRINYPEETPAAGVSSPVSVKSSNRHPGASADTTSGTTTGTATGSADAGATTNGADDHHMARDAAVLAAGAAGGAGVAAGVGSSTPGGAGLDSPSGSSPIQPHEITTTKQVRELQPHVYAPQSTENSGPTQARSNSAARNSMLMSKRRSVLMPISPVKDLKTRGDESPTRSSPTRSSTLPEGSLPEGSVVEGSQSHSFGGAGAGAATAGAAAAAAGAAGAAGAGHSGSTAANLNETRDLNSSQVKSFVTEHEGDLQDERFVSAVDLNDGSKESHDIPRSRGHSRGLSLGLGDSEGRADDKTKEDEDFHRLEKQLGGMPGGIPGGFPSSESTSTLNAASGGDNTAATAAADSSSSSHAAGLRRSEPQTNLSEKVSSDEPASADTEHVGAPGAGLIGLSNQLSSQPSDVVSHDRAVTTDQGVSSKENPKDEFKPSHAQNKSLDFSSPAAPASRGTEKAADNTNAGSTNAGNTNAGGLTSGSAANAAAIGGAGAVGAAGAAGVAAELAQLRKEVNMYRQRQFDNEHHQLKMEHSQALRELANLKDSNGQLTRKHASISGQNSDLKNRYDQIEKVMDGHIATLKSQQAALDEANATIKAQRQELALLPSLKSENADLKLKLKTAESAQKHAEEQLAALTNSYSTLKSAHSDLSAKHLAVTTGNSSKDANGANGAADPNAELSSRVGHLTSLWEKFKLPAIAGGAGAAGAAAGAAGSRGLDAQDSDSYRSLYETQKQAADQASLQLQQAYEEQVELKRQLRDLSAAHAASPSSADLDALRDQHKSALSSLHSEHSSTLSSLNDKHRALNEQHQASLRELKQHSSSLEDLKARLRSLEASHAELQSEYQKAVSLSRNQQVALTKTREELNMSRAHAQRLEEQLEDASVQNSSLHADNNSSVVEGDVSHASVNSGRNDQAAMVIRDLRAQVVILEEEMQNQREQIMRLKKAALNH